MTPLEIVNEVTKICVDNGISYSLDTLSIIVMGYDEKNYRFSFKDSNTTMYVSPVGISIYNCTNPVKWFYLNSITITCTYIDDMPFITICDVNGEELTSI